MHISMHGGQHLIGPSIHIGMRERKKEREREIIIHTLRFYHWRFGFISMCNLRLGLLLFTYVDMVIYTTFVSSQILDRISVLAEVYFPPTMI